MSRQAKIHGGKTPFRIHFIAEWAERRHLRQTDFVEALDVDKGLVSRWFSGSLPQASNLERIAGLLEVDVNMLFRHPDEDWLSEFFKGRSEEERNRARQVLEIAFPPKTGTDG
jgi:transcriptional regulator with XRE-family HTH domain